MEVEDKLDTLLKNQELIIQENLLGNFKLFRNNYLERNYDNRRYRY